MDPVNEATKLLEELGITALPIIPKEICQRLDIGYREDPLKGFEGTLIVYPSTGDGVICVNSNIIEQTRKNFTGAHEIGHYCLDSRDQNVFRCSREVIESFKPTIHPMELRANEFAAELLMPKSIYQPLIDRRDPGWSQIRELTPMSQTSLISTARRFIDLTDEACCLIVSEGKRTVWFCKSEEFRAYIQFGPLSSETVAYAVFQGIDPPERFEDVKADNWLTGRGVKSHTEILEWSLSLNSYGQVLTLLYDEEGISGWDEEDYEEEDDDVVWEPPTFHKSKRKG